MGNSASEQRVEDLQRNYSIISSRNDRFFGSHTLLTNPNRNCDVLIRKELVFRSDNQYQHFLKEYQRIDRKPFNLIYPKTVIEKETFQNCSTVREVKVYFEIVGQSLRSIIETRGILSEVKAWFLLNEISKALEILDQKYKRAHWAISPETIFLNKTNNYLLYDSFFVFGHDPTHFLIETSKTNEPVTEKIKMLLQRGSAPGEDEGREQDTYALGFIMLFSLAGVLPSTLPPYPLQTHDVEMIVKSRNPTVSQQMIEIIKLLTHRSSAKRMDNIQLRRLLREKEAEIIHQESQEYMMSRRKSTSNPSLRHQHRSPLPVTRDQAGQRLRFMNPSYSPQMISTPEFKGYVPPGFLLKELRNSQSNRAIVKPEQLRLSQLQVAPRPFQVVSAEGISHYRLRSLDVTRHGKMLN